MELNLDTQLMIKKKKVGILWNIILKALSSAKVTSKVMAKQRRECKLHS